MKDIALLKKLHLESEEANMNLTKKGAVFFDINTSRDSAHTITTLGAVHCASNKAFEKKVNKPSELSIVLQDFLSWLQTLNDGKPVGLIAHNCFAFDKPTLERSAASVGLKISSSVISAYYDSMLAYKDFLKVEKRPSLDVIAGNDAPRRDHGALHDSKLLKNCILKTLSQENLKIRTFFESRFKLNEIE